MKIDKDRATLLVLSLLREREMYGYEMIRELRRRSDNTFNFKEGTLYPLLHRMEVKEWIVSRQSEAENGHTRTYYAITQAGRSRYKEELAQWDSFAGSVGHVIGWTPELGGAQ